MAVTLATACVAAPPVAPGEQPAIATGVQAREMRGAEPTFATAGVALAWGILRGTGDAPPVVDVRLAVDPMTYPRVIVVGRDAEASRERLLASSLTAGLTDVRVARSAVERYARTEFRFFATAKPVPRESPALVVYFVGLPGATPEFPNEARLDASLSARIVAAKATAKSR